MRAPLRRLRPRCSARRKTRSPCVRQQPLPRLESSLQPTGLILLQHSSASAALVQHLCRQIRKAIPTNKTQHKRPLNIDEIGQLLRDVEGHGGRHETIAAFRLMGLTLCRPNEAAEAQWAEFDLDKAIWRIPAERMKKRKEHSAPLPVQAVEMLRVLQGITGRYTHLFPHRDERTRPMVAASFRRMLKALGWSGKYSPLATRTTGSTRLNDWDFQRTGLSNNWPT